MNILKRITLLGSSVMLLAGFAAGMIGTIAAAADQSSAATAKISFTFDDSLASAYTQAAPTLAKYGLKGTDYVITGCVGMTTIPNTCHANNDASYMTWTQVKALKNTYGWEIGSHTVTHPYLATYDASDGQPKALTNQQVINEIANSKAALAAQGIDATAFSTPYGDYNNFTLATIAKYYTSHRGFADSNNNDWPYNDYLLNDYRVQVPITPAAVEAKIDAAIANKQWLILTMHDIMPNPSTNPDDYQYATSNLAAIAAYVKTKVTAGLIKNVNVSDGVTGGTTNLMPNSTFNSGINNASAGGWTTDNTTAITLDSANNGSYPDATKSVKLSSSAAAAHLESPKIGVGYGNTYLVKSFLNVSAIKTGEIGYYIDEYDANGNWISGQWKTSEKSSFVEAINFKYTPTSANVSSASLQVYTTANSGVTAYVDNVQWYQNGTVARTNLFTNGDFKNGITGGWTTDDTTNIIADKANHGGPTTPADSVSLTANATQNTHLFSPTVPVSPTASYTLQSYLNITARTSGEVAYYIDEYDANGNWVSGQYKIGVQTTGVHNVGFTYVPSSASVASMRFQLIVVGNSGIKAYFDDVVLSRN